MGQDWVTSKDETVNHIENDQKALKKAFREQNAVATDTALHRLYQDVDLVNQSEHPNYQAIDVYDQVVLDNSRTPNNEGTAGLPSLLIVPDRENQLDIRRDAEHVLNGFIDSKSDEIGLAHLTDLAQQTYHTDLDGMLSQDARLVKEVASGEKPEAELAKHIQAGVSADPRMYWDLLNKHLKDSGLGLELTLDNDGSCTFRILKQGEQPNLIKAM